MHMFAMHITNISENIYMKKYTCILWVTSFGKLNLNIEKTMTVLQSRSEQSNGNKNSTRKAANNNMFEQEPSVKRHTCPFVVGTLFGGG